MPLTCTVADVEARWRELETDEFDVAAVLVADALSKLRARRPTLATLIDAADTAAAATGATAAEIQTAEDWNRLVKELVAGAVVAVLVNPDRYRSTSIGSDGSLSVGYDNAAVSGADRQPRITFTRADLADVDRMIAAAGGTVPGLTSIALQSPGTAPDTTATSTLPTP